MPPLAEPKPGTSSGTARGPLASGGAHAASRRERDGDKTFESLDATLSRYAGGEDGAFGELYRLGAPRIRGFLLRLCGDAALADDLTQETFLRVHRARGSFADRAAALPWMFAIARNVLRDQARRALTRPGLRRNGEPDESEASGSGARGDEVLVAQETMIIVQKALDALPLTQREAFVLIRWEGLSIGEAAEVLGATEGAVKVRAFRAYEAIRAALGGSRGREG